MRKKVDLLLREYWLKAQNALLNFQFIEEGIKMYLAIVYEIVEKKLSNQIPFKFSYNDIKNDPLGRLVAKFEKVNHNKQLIDKLKDSVKHRNYCAHRAYLMTVKEQRDAKYLSGEIKKMETVIKSSKECLTNLQRELRKLDKIKIELLTVNKFGKK